MADPTWPLLENDQGRYHALAAEHAASIAAELLAARAKIKEMEWRPMMSDPLTDAQLAEIAAREKAATELYGHELQGTGMHAHYKSDVRMLLAEIARLREEIQDMKDCAYGSRSLVGLANNPIGDRDNAHGQKD